MTLIKLSYKMIRLTIKNIYNVHIKRDKLKHKINNRNIDDLELYIDKYLKKQEKDLQNVSLL